MVNVLIGADICPIGVNVPYFESGDAATLFHDLLPELERADLVVANLECPFISNPSPIEKTGPNFGQSGASVNGIKAAGVDVLGLANNHIMDHGHAGLVHTLAVCAGAQIDTVGAGATLAEARQIQIRRVGQLRVGILAMAEHEFSIADNETPGANPMDPLSFVRIVKQNCGLFDYLIVLYHGGDEFLVPSPRVQNLCRFMIEMGANTVIVQHPHVLGGYEEYLGGHIVYGQGALIMDEMIYRKRESFHEGFLVNLAIADDRRSIMSIVPFTQSDPAPGARRLAPGKEVAFRERLAERARAILDPAFVEAEWSEFCEKHRHAYLSALLGHNRFLRKLNAHGSVTRGLYRKRQLLGVKNVVCCETHREALEVILRNALLQ